MQITVRADELARALRLLLTAISRKTKLPVLGGVLFHVVDGAVTLSATDLLTRIEATIPGRNEGTGAVVIPARDLLAFARGIGKGHTMEIATGESIGEPRIHLTGPTGRTTLRGYPDSEYPLDVTTERTSTWTFSVAAGRLRDALAATLFAMADEVRPILSGIAIDIAGDTAKVTACDNYRIATVTIPLLDGWERRTIVLRPTTAKSLFAALARLEGIVTFTGFAAPLVTIDLPSGARITGSLLDGTYPNYESVIPTTAQITGTLDVDAFASAVALFPRDALIVKATIEPESIHLATTHDGEPTSATVPGLFNWHGDQPAWPLQISFNPRYLADVAKAPDATVSLTANGPLTPALFRANDWRYCVMPVRTV